MKRMIPACALVTILTAHTACAQQPFQADAPVAGGMTCEIWSGSRFIGENKPFAITHIVMAQSGFRMGGRSLIGRGVFEFAPRRIPTAAGPMNDTTPFPIALTGDETGTRKNFITPNGYAVNFNEEAGLRRVILVNGGEFDRTVWNTAAPQRLDNPLYCIRKGDRILSVGAAGGPRAIPAAPPPPAFPEPAMKPDIAMSLPPDRSFTDGVLGVMPVAIPAPPPVNPLSGMVPVSRYTPATPVVRRTAQGPCDRRLSAVTMHGGAPDDIAFVGRIATTQAGEYWYSPSVDIFREETLLDLSSRLGQHVALETASTEPLEIDGAARTVMPVRFPGIDDLPQVGAQPSTPPEPDTVRLMILGDPATLTEAGLEDFGRFLQQELPGYATDVTWHSIAKDGTLDDGVRYGGLGELADRAADLSTTDPKARLDTEAELKRFYDGLVRRLENAPVIYDAVLWITPGTQFPVETPGLTRDMIRNVHRGGRIRRTNDDAPAGDWLYVYSSQIAGFSGAFIKEVIERTTPRPGIFVERSAGSGGAIIENPELVAKRLRRIIDTGTPVVAAEAEDGTRHVDRDEAMDDIAILMSRGVLDGMIQATDELQAILNDRSAGWDSLIRARYKNTYDPTALLDFRSDRKGRPVHYLTDGRTPERIGARLLKAGSGADATVDIRRGAARLVHLNRNLVSLRDQLGLDPLCTYGVLYLEDADIRP